MDPLFTSKSAARIFARSHWKEFLQDSEKKARLLNQFEKFLLNCGPEGRILVTYPLPDELDLLGPVLKSGRPVYVPLALPDGVMEFYRQDRDGVLERSRPGHREIPGGSPENPPLDLPLQNTDIVVIPSLALSPGNRRLGRGGGYYDRWKDRMSTALRVSVIPEKLTGLAFPEEEHDMQINLKITENGTPD